MNEPRSVPSKNEILERLQDGIDDASEEIKARGPKSPMYISAEWLLKTCTLAKEALSGDPSQVETSDWRPIDTAPMDGTEILTLRDAIVSTHAVAFWSDHGGVHGWAICGSNVRLLRVTHWMPLPPKPGSPVETTEHVGAASTATPKVEGTPRGCTLAPGLHEKASVPREPTPFQDFVNSLPDTESKP